MKRIISILLVFLLCISFAACSKKVKSISISESEVSVYLDETHQLEYKLEPEKASADVTWESSDPTVATVDNNGLVAAIGVGTASIKVSAGDDISASCTVTVSRKEIIETNYTTIKGLYVDESYRDSKSDDLRLVYMVYTVKTDSENLKVSSITQHIIVDDINDYTAEHIPDVNRYMDNYYYSSYIENVYTGTELNVISTFKIPSTELVAGKVYTFSNSYIPETENLCFFSDHVKTFKTAEELAKEIDPEGYKSELDKQKPADSETEAKVKNQLYQYDFNFYVNNTSYKLSFSSPNRFTLRTAYNTSSGTYVVKNGYVSITHDSNNETIDIPYDFKENGDINLHTAEAFDVKG
ncbi:MAG: Ig-like domain-containing protein [Clostridia bacterium]|nr:Ig-like domain-containing protein [Clostridia bacterium]